MKYTVNNCPAKTDLYCYNTKELKYCQDYNNCLLKQIIKKCKETLEQFNASSGKNMYSAGKCITSEDILQLFDIKEEK